MIYSFDIDYKNINTELCFIGSKYDTDKSSMRENVTNDRHCHPYTIFYHDLFNKQRHEQLKIAEIGIYKGSSLLMWAEYFHNSMIHGFEYNQDYIDEFHKRFDHPHIKLFYMDVQSTTSIHTNFEISGEQYDLIVDDSTHQFDDQIRIIKYAHPFLKPGGVLIIEDIFKSYNEQDYYNHLKDFINDIFQDFFFISMDHSRRNSFGWDNDKLFVLIKKGQRIFNNIPDYNKIKE